MNLIDVTKSDFSADIVQKISSFVGESPDHTQQAVNDAVPSVFAGMMDQASSPSGASRLFDIARRSGQEKSDLLTGLGSVFGSGSKTTELGQEGQGLMSNLFGERQQLITDKVASHAGVSPGAAQKIFSLVGPITMAVVGKEVVSRGLNAGGLTTMLASHKSLIAGAVGGLGLAKVFGGLAGGEAYTRPTVEKSAPFREAVSREGREITPKGTRWLPLVLLGALVAIGLAYLLRGANHQRAPSLPAMKKPHVSMPEVNRALPTAENIGTAGEKLGQYLESDSDLPKSFVLNGLAFSSTGMVIAGTESQQLDGIASALKSHQNAHVAINGYAQNEDEGVNQANAVRDQLMTRGVPAEQVTTAGHGTVAAGSANEAGQATSRRVELTVTAR